MRTWPKKNIDMYLYPLLCVCNKRVCFFSLPLYFYVGPTYTFLLFVLNYVSFGPLQYIPTHINANISLKQTSFHALPILSLLIFLIVLFLSIWPIGKPPFSALCWHQWIVVLHQNVKACPRFHVLCIQHFCNTMPYVLLSPSSQFGPGLQLASDLYH